MKLIIPEPLRLREEAIRTALRGAAEAGGETGESAALLEAILLPHLDKERIDILQPLGLLPQLARGEITSEMAGVLPQIRQLKNDLHALQIEHATVLSAIKRFVSAARAEGKLAHAGFAERLLFRAWLDESVFTPLAILIGEYLEQRLDRQEPHPSARFANSRAVMKLELPEALQLSHTQLSAALIDLSGAGGRTGFVLEKIANLLEPHLKHEEAKVLRILGLLAPLAAGRFEPGWSEDIAQSGELETNESALDLEHGALIAAGEELLAIAREEKANDALEFAERLLLRIRLDEEVFYPAALLIRNYLGLRPRNLLSKESASVSL